MFSDILHQHPVPKANISTTKKLPPTNSYYTVFTNYVHLVTIFLTAATTDKSKSVSIFVNDILQPPALTNQCVYICSVLMREKIEYSDIMGINDETLDFKVKCFDQM